MPEVDETLKNWVDRNPEWFEKAILWHATFNAELQPLLARAVCRGSDGGSPADFSNPVMNSYFNLVREFKKQQPATAITHAVSRLIAATAPGEQLASHEIPMFTALYDELSEQPGFKDYEQSIRGAIGYWLGKRRLAHTVTRRIAFTDWEAKDVASGINQEIQFLSGVLEEGTHVAEFSHLVFTIRPSEVGCIPSGLTVYDRQLGGGFHVGEGHLVIAAPGVGKTVFALQMAAQAAALGYHVAFITTEQPADELVPRILANRCNIKFNTISRNYNFAKLDPRKQQRVQEIATKLHKRLFFYDWNIKKKTVESGGLEEEYEDCVKRSGRCDMLLLDWIGGSITDESRNDKDKKRLAMQNAADATAQLGRDKKIVTVAMAQAHKSLGINNPVVSVSDCTDCKTMDQRMTVVSGLTGMLSKDAKAAVQEGKDPAALGLFETQQWIYTSKARKSVGGHAPFRRSFEYQRMEDIG